MDGMPMKMEWIYWRWKGNKAFHASLVRDIDNDMLYLCDNRARMNMPTMVCIDEIDWKVNSLDREG